MNIQTDACASTKTRARTLRLPEDAEVSTYSNVHLPSAIAEADPARETVARALEQPIADFYARPGKRFRSQLVHAGFLLGLDESARDQVSRRDRQLCRQLGESLEAIHAGSLIIDDIQDQSAERRGSPTLHEKFGTPLAINAGNWLYFRAFELIRELSSSHQLDAKIELRLYRLCHQVMLDAHIGQAVDLGAQISKVPRQRVFEICIANLKLKTGSLMALALGAGAILCEVNDITLSKILHLGQNLGVCLQMFDDLGNLSLDSSNPKRFEDLALDRPSWAWAAAAENSNEIEYREFILAVQTLPNTERILDWLAAQDLVAIARRQAQRHAQFVIASAEKSFSPQKPSRLAFQIINELLERIQISYG